MQEYRKKKPKKPKKITEKYLDNVSAYYLGRYASSSANLKRILMRRALKSCEYHKTPLEEAEELIDNLVKKYQELGYLDDKKYANNLARQLREKGKSKRQIIAKMYEKLVPEYLVEEAISKIDKELGEDVEIKSALKLAKKRKIGPFRPKEQRQEYWKKDLGILARAGFSYDVASSILENSTEYENDIHC